jgi:sulfotransferase family protein
MDTPQVKESGDDSRHGPLFVVGMWRSGTSLFYALLNQHPQISLFYEGDLPLLWPLFLGRKAKSDWPERWEFWNSAPTRHQIELRSLPRDVSTLREACETVWRQHAGPVIGGCKSPNYFDMLPGLAKKFPNARFIVIWRDPMDICRSVVRASKTDTFFAKRGMLLRTLCGYHELKQGYDTLLSNGTPVHEVQYETLVNDPSEVMAGVCRFLNLDFHRRMVSLQDADRSAIYDAGHHEMVRSERIAHTKGQSEILPGGVRRKIMRYVARWHKQQEGKWPAVPQSSDFKPSVWFAVEPAWDSILYRILRTLDWGIVFIYCFAPLWLLRKYRVSRGRGETVAMPEERLVGVSAKD